MLNLPVGFSVSFTIVSLATWDKLDDKTKAFMESAVKGQTDKWWKTIIDEDNDGPELHHRHRRVHASASRASSSRSSRPPADDAILETAMKDVVLKRWAKRCGGDASCISNWNDTIGKVVNLTAAPVSHAEPGRMERASFIRPFIGRPHCGGRGLDADIA